MLISDYLFKLTSFHESSIYNEYTTDYTKKHASVWIVGEYEISDSSCSLVLLGKSTPLPDFRYWVQNNMLQLLENFSGSNAPDYPTYGQLWYDTAPFKLDGVSYVGTPQTPYEECNLVLDATTMHSKNGRLRYYVPADSFSPRTGYKYESVIATVNPDGSAMRNVGTTGGLPSIIKMGHFVDVGGSKINNRGDILFLGTTLGYHKTNGLANNKISHVFPEPEEYQNVLLTKYFGDTNYLTGWYNTSTGLAHRDVFLLRNDAKIAYRSDVVFANPLSSGDAYPNTSDVPGTNDNRSLITKKYVDTNFLSGTVAGAANSATEFNLPADKVINYNSATSIGVPLDTKFVSTLTNKGYVDTNFLSGTNTATIFATPTGKTIEYATDITDKFAFTDQSLVTKKFTTTTITTSTSPLLTTEHFNTTINLLMSWIASLQIDLTTGKFVASGAVPAVSPPISAPSIDATVLNNLTTATISNLTPAKVSGLTAEEIKKLEDAGALGGLTTTQITVLTTSQVSQLSADTAAKMLGTLTDNSSVADLFGKLTNSQLTNLDNTTTLKLIDALTPTQIFAMPAANAVALIENLTDSTKVLDLMKILSPEQLGEFTATSLKNLSNADIGNLQTSYISSINPLAIGGLTDAQKTSFDKDQLNAMTNSQITALLTTGSPSADTIASIIKSLNATSIRYVPATVLNAMSTTDISSIPADTRLGMTGSQLSGLTGAQIAAMLNGLTDPQKAIIRAAAKTATTLTAEQQTAWGITTGALTSEQLAAVTPETVQFLSSDIIVKLTTTDITQLITNNSFVTMENTQLASFTADQLAKLTATNASTLMTQLNLTQQDILRTIVKKASNLTAEQQTAWGIPTKVDPTTGITTTDIEPLRSDIELTFAGTGKAGELLADGAPNAASMMFFMVGDTGHTGEYVSDILDKGASPKITIAGITIVNVNAGVKGEAIFETLKNPVTLKVDPSNVPSEIKYIIFAIRRLGANTFNPDTVRSGLVLYDGVFGSNTSSKTLLRKYTNSDAQNLTNTTPVKSTDSPILVTHIIARQPDGTWTPAKPPYDSPWFTDSIKTAVSGLTIPTDVGSHVNYIAAIKGAITKQLDLKLSPPKFDVNKRVIRRNSTTTTTDITGVIEIPTNSYDPTYDFDQKTLSVEVAGKLYNTTNGLVINRDGTWKLPIPCPVAGKYDVVCRQHEKIVDLKYNSRKLDLLVTNDTDPYTTMDPFVLYFRGLGADSVAYVANIAAVLFDDSGDVVEIIDDFVVSDTASHKLIPTTQGVTCSSLNGTLRSIRNRVVVSIDSTTIDARVCSMVLVLRRYVDARFDTNVASTSDFSLSTYKDPYPHVSSAAAVSDAMDLTSITTPIKSAKSRILISPIVYRVETGIWATGYEHNCWWYDNSLIKSTGTGEYPTDAAMSKAQLSAIASALKPKLSSEMLTLTTDQIIAKITAITPTGIATLASDQITALGVWASTVSYKWKDSQLASPVTTAQIAALTPQPDVLTTGQLVLLTTAQIGSLTSVQIPSLTSVQIPVLTTAQISALTSSAIGALTSVQIPVLTTDQLVLLTTAQIGALTSVQTTALTSVQIQVLTNAQIGRIPTKSFIALTPTQIAAFTTSQITSFSAGRISIMPTSQISALTTTQVGALTTQQAIALATSQIGALTSAQIVSFTTNQISVLTTAQMAAFSTSAIGALTSDQFLVLTTKQIEALTTAQIPSLTTSVIAAFDNVRVTALTATQGEALTTTQIRALDQLVSGLDNTLSPAQIAAVMPGSRPFVEYQIKRFTSTQLAALTATQLGEMAPYELAWLGDQAIAISYSWTDTQKAEIKNNATLLSALMRT